MPDYSKIRNQLGMQSAAEAEERKKNDLEKFKENTRTIESSNGTNLNHAVIQDPKSRHYGTRAGGAYGFMPLVAQDFIKQTPSLKEKYSDLLSAEPDDVTEALNTNRDLSEDLANVFASKLYKRYDGDPLKMRYAWFNGEPAANKARYSDILNHKEVRKYMKLAGLLPNATQMPNRAPASEEDKPEEDSPEQQQEKEFNRYASIGRIFNKTPDIQPVVPGNLSPDRNVTTIPDGKGGAINIPNTINGQVVSDKEAIQHYKKTKQHFGMYSSVDDAVKAAKVMRGE